MDVTSTLQGAHLDRVQTPTLVSTGEAMTRGAWRATEPELASDIAAYNYASAHDDDLIFPLFYADLATTRLSVTVTFSSPDGDVEQTRVAIMSDVRVGPVLTAINIAWADVEKVAVEARMDGSRVVLTARSAAVGFDPISLRINNSADINAGSANHVWAYSFFRYYAPDPRAVSRVGDPKPPPPRPGLFITPQSRGVAHGEERTSHAVNRGLDDVVHQLEHTRDVSELPVRYQAFNGLMARPPEVPAPTVGSVLPISVSVRTVVLEEVEGTFIWLRGARWLVDPPFVQLIDTTRNAHLALYSRKDDEERHGDDTYYDPSQYDWKVHYGPTAWSETDLATDASIGAAVPLQSSVTYVMVDPTTVEFSAIFDPTEQVTQAILRDVDTGESMYVVSWMGPSRARVGRLDERALLRHNAAVRAGASVGDYSITLPGGKLDMYRGPFIEPHEYVTKFIPGFFPDTNDVLHHITVVGAHAGIHPAFEQAVADDVPQDVTEYATHVALLQRRGPYARELGPLVSDEHILQAGRLGLNHSQLSTNPVGPYDATTILKSDVGAEARAATNAATALASTTTVHLPVPAVGANPLRFKDMTEDDLDKIAYLLSRASGDLLENELYTPTDEEVATFLADVEPGELARQRSLARRYLHKQVAGLAVYPIDRRAVSDEGAFTYDMIGRSGYFYVVNADANVVTITGVLSPYQVEFEFVDYANKDVSDTAWQGATLFLVPDATSSIRHYSLRAASASRYWRNFQSGDEVLPSGTVQFAPSDPLVDVVANTQLASGTRLPAPAFDNASLKRDLSNFTVLPESNRPTYLVLEKNSGSWVTNPLLNNLTSGAVRTIELLYGRSDASSTLDEMFNVTPSHVENTFAMRSPVWYEYFFTTETGLMFRGRCHASEAMAYAPNGTIAALALPIPDDYFPLITESVITYAVSLRVNSLYLEGHKSHLVHTLTQELDVRGRAHVVPYENDDDRTGIELTATDRATSSLSSANVYHGEVTRATLSVNAGAALCEVIHESDRCIITPSSMELYAPSTSTPSATTPSVGPYMIDKELLEEIEEQYAEALNEINTLKQTLSSMFTVLRLNVNASRGLSAELTRLMQYKYMNDEHLGIAELLGVYISLVLSNIEQTAPGAPLRSYLEDPFQNVPLLTKSWEGFVSMRADAWYTGLPLALSEDDIDTLVGLPARRLDESSDDTLDTWVAYFYGRVVGDESGASPWEDGFSVGVFQSVRHFLRFYRKLLDYPMCATLRAERMRTGSHPLPVATVTGRDIPLVHNVGTPPGTELGTEVLVIEDMTKMLDVIEQTWEARYPMEMSTPSLLISSSTASAGIDEPPLLLPGGRLDLRVTNTLGVPPGERTGIFKQRSLGGRRGAVNALPYTYVNGSGLPTLGGEITSVSHLLEWINASTTTETCLPLFAFSDQGAFYRSLYVGETRGQAQSEYPYTPELFAVWSSVEIPSSPTPTLWYTFTSGLRYKELPYAEIGYDYPISNQVAAETTRSPVYWGNIAFKYTSEEAAIEAIEALGSGQQYYFIYPLAGAFYVTLNTKGFSEYTRLARKAYFPNKRGITFRKAKNTTSLS
jgi:hypothetical protein